LSDRWIISLVWWSTKNISDIVKKSEMTHDQSAWDKEDASFCQCFLDIINDPSWHGSHCQMQFKRLIFPHTKRLLHGLWSNSFYFDIGYSSLGVIEHIIWLQFLIRPIFTTYFETRRKGSARYRVITTYKSKTRHFVKRFLRVFM
jgi:hypothetical protein